MPTEDRPLPESVLFVVTRGDSIGGGQIHVRDLSRELKRRGVRVLVVAGSYGALQHELDRIGVDHELVPTLRRSIDPIVDLRAIVAVARIVRKFRPQIVSTHTAKAGLVGRLAAFFTRTPFLFTAHGWQFAEGIALWQKAAVLAVEHVLARLTKRIVTVSEYDRSLALRSRLGSPAKIRLVHNGMPYLPVTPRTRTTEKVRLVMVARFQEQKDHASLFAALERLESLPWSLDLVGDGPDLDRWNTWVEQRGWNQRVRFHGQILTVPELLDECDVFVLASLWEGFPRSILEAMRASLPVVATDVGGVCESVVDRVTGFLVPVRDVEALARTLEILICDELRRLEMGKKGRERFDREFTFQAMFEKTADVWSAVWT